MIIKGQHTINYTLNGENKRICIKIKLKPNKNHIKPHQASWCAEGTINGKTIDRSELIGCVNAQLVAEDIAEDRIKKLRKEHGRSLRIKKDL